MGEVSRFLANVFSLGAVKKVDDAMDGYRSVVRKYNDYVDQSTKLEDEIDILEKNINKYTKFYDSNKKIVLEILKNEEACKKLATGELDDLKSFLNNSLVVSSRLSTNLYFDDIFFSDDSVGADFATCATCACIPVFGSIGLRMIANDDIERIYSEKRKIVGNIDKLKEHIESLVTCKCKLEKKLNVQKNIRKIIMNYIKNNILLLQKKNK